MGRLVGLELHNFKSYRGTASIGFGTANFTSIIGPNGSGKSNMMDAISFVLGVRSSQLRSNQLKDLIYRGRLAGAMSVEEEDEDEDQDDLMEVTGDPERAYVKAIYEKSDGEILQLKRTINSSGSSEYRINNKPTSAAEYSNILKKENILIKARNFLVFQGDVEQIASQSSADLSKLIETVSGSIEFKKEYESLKEEQEVAKNEYATLLSKKRALNGEIKQYREQRLEAELFKSKLNEKNELTQLLTLWKLYHIEQKKEKLQSSFADSKAQLKKLKSEATKKESEVKSIKSKHAKEALKSSKYQKYINEKKVKIQTKKLQLHEVEADKTVIKNKITGLNKNIKANSNDSEKQRDYVQAVEKQIKVVSKAKVGAQKEINERNQTSQISVEDQQEYETLKQIFLSEGGGASEDEKLALLNTQRDELKSILANLDTQNSAAAERVNDLKSQKADIENYFASTSTELNQKNNQLNEKKNIVRDLNKNREDYQAKEFELQSKLKEVLTNLDDLNANQRETNRERKLRENVSILKRHFNGVIGLVHDVCQPKQKKYEVAVSTILGKNFDSIIVENSAIAHQCIQFLKDQRSGVASFIPLDTIDARPIDSKLRHLGQNAKPTIDIVDYDSYLERAIQFACGSSIVCDDISTAKSIRWDRGIDVKVVTLDGSLIHKAGLMTGGKTKNQERRWNKTEVQGLTKLRDDLFFQLDDLQSKRPETIEIKNLENDILNLETEISVLRRRRSELERNLLSTDAEIKHYVEGNQVLKKIQEHKSKLDSLESKIQAQESIISDLQTDIFKDFCQRLGFHSIKEYEATSGSQLREQSRELQKLDNQLITLNAKLSFEKDRFDTTQKRVDRLKNALKEQETHLNKLIKDEELINDAIDHLESELELIIEEFKEFEKANHESLKIIKDIDDQYSDLTRQRDHLKKDLINRQEDIEKFVLERLAILKTCKIENITIPLLESSLEDLPIENNEEIIEISEGIIVDYSRLNSRYKENNNELISKEFEEKISSISKELDGLSPNIKAIERLDEVEKKSEELEKESIKARASELKIVKKFQEVKNKRYDLFNGAFNHISEKIDAIYKELTKANASSTLGGGSAALSLDDEDEPYLSGVNYHVTPPMKRFQGMDSLSGGEKTVAALALLFAIHSFNPSPFFVLDEVDAALDNSNVNKIANYIAKHSGPDFQFIVISLKNGLFEKSDALVGIYREQQENSSKTLTLDLRSYPAVA